jgi:hypothetical protein
VPIEVQTGSTVALQPIVTTVKGSGTKDAKTVQAPGQIRALRKKAVTWRKVVVPLEKYRGIEDWSTILEMVFVFENRLGSDYGIIYLDDVVFGTNLLEAIPSEPLKTRLAALQYAPLKPGVSAAALRGIRMASRQAENDVFVESVEGRLEGKPVSEALGEAQFSSREKLKKFFDLEKTAEFTDEVTVPEIFLLILKAAPIEPTLETIRLEVSTDKGKTWNIVTNFYSHQKDGEYIFPWRMGKTRPGQDLRLRLTASDIWGRSRTLQEPISFKVN